MPSIESKYQSELDQAKKRVENAAKDAWRGISFDPEKRAKSFTKDFEESAKNYLELISSIDGADAKAFLEKFTSKAVAYLNAKSRTLSPMITGPARFPVAKNEKALAAERKRGEEFFDFPDYFIQKAEKQAKKDSGYFTPSGELERAKENLEVRRKAHEKMKAANKIIRSKKDVETRLKEIGFTEKQINDLLNPSFGRPGYETFQLANNNAEIKRLEGRVKALESKQVAAEKLGTPTLKFDGGQILKNFEDDRLQIQFDDIPDPEFRNALKRNGFRWSPKNKAWQRKLTGNSFYALQQLREKLSISQEELNDFRTNKTAIAEMKELNKKVLEYDELPNDIKAIIDQLSDAPEYKDVEVAKATVEKLGWTFEYGLDGGPYDFRKIEKKPTPEPIEVDQIQLSMDFDELAKKPNEVKRHFEQKEEDAKKKATGKRFNNKQRSEMARKIKAIVGEVVGDKKEPTPEEVLKIARKINSERSLYSQFIDATDDHQIRRAPTVENLKTWAKNPGKSDIIGVDSFKKADPTLKRDANSKALKFLRKKRKS